MIEDADIRDRCWKGLDCNFNHTKEEEKIFQVEIDRNLDQNPNYYQDKKRTNYRTKDANTPKYEHHKRSRQCYQNPLLS